MKDVACLVAESPAGVSLGYDVGICHHSHCSLVSEIGDPVTVPEHVVVVIDPRENAVGWDLVVFDQTQNSVMMKEHCVIIPHEFRSLSPGVNVKPLYGVGDLDVFAPGIKNGGYGIIEKLVPILVVVLAAIEVSVHLASQEMN